MSNLSTIDGDITQQSSEDENSNFSRRTIRQYMCPKRYVMALLLSVLLVINEARIWSIVYSFEYPTTDESNKMTEYPLLEISTELTSNEFWISLLIGYIIINILGGLWIHPFSSHKFLLVIVTLSSFMHVLIPTAIKLQTTTFLWIIILGQLVLVAPLFIAVLSVWKHWAPTEERTCLITISFLGIGVEAVSPLIIIAASPKQWKNIGYIVGIAGLIWALIWYIITSSSPKTDRLITDKEYFYLESNIPSHYQEKTKRKDVPLKTICKSKQVLTIFCCFGALGAFIEGMRVNGQFYIIHKQYRDNILIVIIPFIASFIFAFIGSSFLMNFLCKKYKAKALTVRKIFICSGLVLYYALFLGSIAVGYSTVFSAMNAIGYCCFAFSIPGILRSPLDLSPPYVSVISGGAFGCYYFGRLHFLKLNSNSPFDPNNLASNHWLIITFSMLSLFAAILYGTYGDDKEQSWSLERSSQRRENRVESIAESPT